MADAAVQSRDEEVAGGAPSLAGGEWQPFTLSVKGEIEVPPPPIDFDAPGNHPTEVLLAGARKTVGDIEAEVARKQAEREDLEKFETTPSALPLVVSTDEGKVDVEKLKADLAEEAKGKR